MQVRQTLLDVYRYVQDGGSDIRLVATSSGRIINEAESVDGDALRDLADALEQVSNDYQLSELGRLPTVREVVATLAFILGHKPSRLVSGVLEPVQVVVQPPDTKYREGA